ncbi:MAG: hypothetical protein IIA61_07330 [Candidatus Marinimicrobia bacterium]|nr:hypothetical protein [Candidatus Neomarinimicrobiota bacterium]
MRLKRIFIVISWGTRNERADLLQTSGFKQIWITLGAMKNGWARDSLSKGISGHVNGLVQAPEAR